MIPHGSFPRRQVRYGRNDWHQKGEALCRAALEAAGDGPRGRCSGALAKPRGRATGAWALASVGRRDSASHRGGRARDSGEHRVLRGACASPEATIPVVLAPAARGELDAAATRYERDYPGRGERFYAAVERAVTLIAAFHAAAPRSSWVRTPEVRQRVVASFPFVIVYRDLGSVLRIDAVAHTRRQPGYWAHRVR